MIENEAENNFIGKIKWYRDVLGFGEAKGISGSEGEFITSYMASFVPVRGQKVPSRLGGEVDVPTVSASGDGSDRTEVWVGIWQGSGGGSGFNSHK